LRPFGELQGSLAQNVPLTRPWGINPASRSIHHYTHPGTIIDLPLLDVQMPSR
jgi:hypothetical protein